MTRSRPDYVKAHARKVSDVMATEVITAGPDKPLHEIASTLEKYAIKRVPIVKDGQLVGIVSRANLIQAVASDRKKLEISLSDTTIRDKVLAHLKSQRWAHTGLLNATVSDGVVDLWGISNSDTERKAIRVAAELMPGVVAVNDHLIMRPQAWGILSPSGFRAALEVPDYHCIWMKGTASMPTANRSQETNSSSKEAPTTPLV